MTPHFVVITAALVCLVIVLSASGVSAQGGEWQAEVARDTPLLGERFSVRTLSPLAAENYVARQYRRLLSNYVPYVLRNVQPFSGCAGAQFHKRDGSSEHAVRQNATVAYGMATLLLSDAHLENRDHLARIVVAIVRYLAVTHKSNFVPTGDGKQWGDHWQSALWAAYAGNAAWLMWERLDDETRLLVARTVEHEANRFNTRPPDNGEWNDTKAEENAWNSKVIALAECMFPKHPNTSLWRERAIVYMMNSFSTPADHQDNTMVSGRPVKEWVSTVCIHDDYTLENHRRVHPDYVGTIGLLLRNALVYRHAGMEVPEAAFHHVSDCFGSLAPLTATNGSFFYINGQDWWPHRHDVPLNIGGLMGAIMGSSAGAFLEQAALRSFKIMHSRFDDGRAFDPREYNYPNVEEEMMARYAELYLAHRLYEALRPQTELEFSRAVSGSRVFEHGGFVIDRDDDKFASFAWVHGAMGLVYPAGDTWFTSPDQRGLIGRISVEGAEDTNPEVLNRSVRLLGEDEKHGFALACSLGRCKGKIRQDCAMISLPDGPVLYVERLTALESLLLNEARTGLFAVLNEKAPPLADGVRRIRTLGRDYDMVGDSHAPAAMHIWETDSIDLDGRMVIVSETPQRMGYWEKHSYEHSRLQQEVYANVIEGPKNIEAGKVFSEVVIAVAFDPSRTTRVEVQTDTDGVTAVLCDDRVTVVNFRDTRCGINAFGIDVTLEPMSAIVRDSVTR